MAEGRIVLASDVGGHRELIRDSQTGFLFAPDDPVQMADRVIKVLSKKDDHSRISEAARDYVAKERTWTVSASAYRDVYGLALRKRGNAPRSEPVP
jgi:glycosyltransferase involved in cell wall biosynthesis